MKGGRGLETGRLLEKDTELMRKAAGEAVARTKPSEHSWDHQQSTYYKQHAGQCTGEAWGMERLMRGRVVPALKQLGWWSKQMGS